MNDPEVIQGWAIMPDGKWHRFNHALSVCRQWVRTNARVTKARFWPVCIECLTFATPFVAHKTPHEPA